MKPIIGKKSQFDEVQKEREKELQKQIDADTRVADELVIKIENLLYEADATSQVIGIVLQSIEQNRKERVSKITEKLNLNRFKHQVDFAKDEFTISIKKNGEKI